MAVAGLALLGMALDMMAGGDVADSSGKHIAGGALGLVMLLMATLRPLRDVQLGLVALQRRHCRPYDWHVVTDGGGTAHGVAEPVADDDLTALMAG